MPPRRTRRSKPPPRRSLLGFILWSLLLLLAVAAAYAAYLDHVIRVKFEGKRWALPAYVYARPLELFSGAELSAGQLERELRLLDYRFSIGAASPGSY